MNIIKISIGILLFIISFNTSSAYAETLSERATRIINTRECIKNAHTAYRADIREAKNIHKAKRKIHTNRSITRQEFIASRIENKNKRNIALRACLH